MATMKLSKPKGEGITYVKSPKDNIFKRFWKTRFLFFLFLPALIYYILFKYVPMWGISISLYDYSIFKGLAGSKFIGLHHFKVFFNSPDAWRITRNTLVLGLQSLAITFPVTIIFALLLNEVRSPKLKKLTQSVSYMPHFLSTVIIVSILSNLCDPTSGMVNNIIRMFGGKPIYFMTEGKWFRPLYLISEIWAGMGWGSIVYLAAISNVDVAQYEAARLDGAGRMRQIWSITLPSIAPTVATMFILKIGHIMDASMEKVLLMQSAVTYEYSQIISTYTYEMGIMQGAYDFSTAIGLYSNIINLLMLVCANWISKKVTGSGIF